MKSRPLRKAVTVVVLAGAGAFAAFLLLQWSQKSSTANAPGRITHPMARDQSPGSAPDSKSRKGPLDEPSGRRAALELLKEKWLARKGKTAPQGIITVEDEELAKESARQLLCGGEMISLIAYLHSIDYRDGVTALEKAVPALFLSERAEEARTILATLPLIKREPLGNGPYREEPVDYREKWSYSAGQGCPEKDFEAFAASLKDPAAAQNALFGQNAAKAATDPEAAISSTVTALQGSVLASTWFESLKQVVDKIPADADFGNLERLLPAPVATPDGTDPFERGRVTLFRRWAGVDPAAAANYVMSVPDRLGAKMVAVIAEQVVQKTPGSATEWAQEFSEGPYYDEAVGSLIPHIGDGYPEEALELASRISDPALREKSLEVVRGKQERAARSQGH